MLDKQKFAGVVSCDSLQLALDNGTPLESAFLAQPEPVPATTPLNEIFSHVAAAPCAVPVTDEDNQYIGVISKSSLLRALDREGNQ